jgi:putative inorganic carbon (hco3(-)) transporter
MPLTALFFWVIYTAGILGAVMRPIVGVLLYILVYHLNPEAQWWGESVRASGVRTALFAALATVLGIVLRDWRAASSGRQFTWPIMLMLGFALAAIASLTWGPSEGPRGWMVAEKFIKVIGFVLILITCVREPGHYQMVIVAWLCGLFYVGYQAWGNVGIYTDGRLTGGVGGSDFADSSGLAVHLVASLPIIGAMMFICRRWWSRGLTAIVGALVVNTIFLTRTRNAAFGLAAIVCVGAISLPKRYRMRGLLAIAVGVGLALQLADPAWFRRMETVFSYEESTSATSRIEFWKAAYEMALDYPLGVGIGRYHEVVQEYIPTLTAQRSAHSTFMACLAELGFGGLALLLVIIGVTLRRITRIIRRTPADQSELPATFGPLNMRLHLGWHAMALRTALVGYLACGLFTTRLFSEDFWILIGLAASLDRIARDHQAEPDESPAAEALECVEMPVAGWPAGAAALRSGGV